MVHPISMSSSADSRQLQAYEAIRQQILQGELAPNLALSENQLAAQLTLSRTPIRAALKQLEHEGLVRSYPHRGTFVTAVSVQDILEIYQIREQLEGFAARVAAEQLPQHERATLQAELEQARAFVGLPYARESTDLDRSFHQRIVAAPRNSRLDAILATVDDQMYRIRLLSSRSAAWVSSTLEDHSAILACIAARDPQGAEQQMRRHLQRSCENAIQLVTPRAER